MADLPPLLFGAPNKASRSRGNGFPRAPEGPGARRQAERLGPSFERLSRAFGTATFVATDAPEVSSPEHILVLEIAGSIDDFVNAVRLIEGLEFLVEAVEDKVDADDDFAVVDKKTNKRSGYNRQLFVLASDIRAWRELLSLWQRYQDGEMFERGLAKFRSLFDLLRVIRPWNDSDRLNRTGVLEAWKAELADRIDGNIPFEVEFWLRDDESVRREVEAKFQSDIKAAGGQLLATSVIPEIAYHGALAQVPPDKIAESVRTAGISWMGAEGVRFFHASGQMAAISTEEADLIEGDRIGFPVSGDPRVALLDGIPMAGHSAIDGRIVLDDPEGWAELVPAKQRIHGTAMSSLVLNGDLNSPTPVSEPIYVRPILKPANDWTFDEIVPTDRLLVDAIHQAVVRMVGEDGRAPNVRVIVLAVGDRAQQFTTFISPAARLIDWLAWRYGLLFLVSAGNHLDDIAIAGDADLTDAEETQRVLLGAVQNTAALRRLLSPAESVNSVTIGAAHADGSNHPAPDGLVEPFSSSLLPSVISAIGGGHRKAVKPDVLLPGGRQLLRDTQHDGTGDRKLQIPITRRAPGVRVASPPSNNSHSFICGTSCATGIAGHFAVETLSRLESWREFHGTRMPGPEFDDLLVKAALVHGARWESVKDLLYDVVRSAGLRPSREAVSRFVGYGLASDVPPLHSDEHRATIIGANTIHDDESHEFRIPISPQFSGDSHMRRLTLTVAWVSPINPFHRMYRSAALILSVGGTDNFVKRTDVDESCSRRGTLIHDVLVGSRAVPVSPGNEIDINIACRAAAGTLDVPIRYVLAATLEVAAESPIAVYEEVRQALRVPVSVRPRAAYRSEIQE